MVRRLRQLDFFLLLVPFLCATPAGAREWAIDPVQSRLLFEVTQGGQTFTGEFETFDAKIRFDPNAPADARVEATIDVGSLVTPDRSRTEQALSAMWLGALEHPTAQYVATGFRPLEGDRYEVTARLTLKGITREITHEARIAVSGGTATASGTVPLMRTDFDIGGSTGAETVGLEVVVRFELVASSA